MENITSTAGLKYAIQLLEDEQAVKLQLLKEQFLFSIESLKPVNLLKSTMKDIVSSPHLLDNMLNTAVGLATGFLSKKIFIGSSANIIRKLIGSVLQLGITATATQNSDYITSFGRFAFQKVFHKK
jgi:hypothetical protein